MRLELPESKKLVFESVIPIRWGDMDAMGHLNNTSYFRYLETCRLDWMQSIGAIKERPVEGLVLVNAFCNFYRQIKYPGDVLVRMYVSDPTRTACETWATMERTDEPGAIQAAGGATMVWVDFAAGKAQTMPDWLRQIVA